MTLRAPVRFVRSLRGSSFALVLLWLPCELAAGQGGPSLFPAPVYDTGGLHAATVAIGDLNGDGRPDVVVANWASDSVGVLTGNADGTLNAAVPYASGSYPGRVAIGDINRDGRPDVVVSNYGSSAICVLAGNASGTLDAAVSYPSGGIIADDLAIGDVNGDGRLDVVVANYDPNNGGSATVSILAGNAAGTLNAAVSYPAGATELRAVAIGDVNADGLLDVVVTTGTHTVCVLAGNAAGTLGAPISYPSGGNSPTGLAIEDVNGDGRLDVVVANTIGVYTGVVCVLAGNAGGTLDAPVTYPSGGLVANSIAIGDLNGDGRPDVVVGNYESYTICVLAGNAGGTLEAAVSYPAGGCYPVSIAIGDVNGDGRPDAVVADGCLGAYQGMICVLVGNGSGGLNAAVPYASGGSLPLSVAIGDVNGDRRPDVVVANSGSNTICVLAGNANGTLGAAVSYPSGGSTPNSIAIGDVNGDGRPDVVVANVNSSVVSVLAGNANGTLDAAVAYAPGGTGSISVAIGDVNGDGRPDVVVANRSSNTVCVLAGNAAGTLDAAVCYSSGGSQTRARAVAIGDVTGDGRPDVVVVNEYPSTVCVLAGNAGGTLDPVVSYPSGGARPYSVAIGDLNGDGRPDVVVANWASGTVAVLTGNAAGTLDAAVSYPAGGDAPGAAAVAIGDVNGDGRPDVVVANMDSFLVCVLAGNVGGTLTAAVLYIPGGTVPVSIAIGDLNCDGRPDLVVANKTSNTVAVLLNQYSGTNLFSFCDGSGELGYSCPCGNSGLFGHGCENSSSTGGAQLTASGSTNPDTVVLMSSGELPSVLSLFMQGNAAISPVSYGDGLRCAAGHLRRLFIRNASSGSVTAPQGSDPSITARSAALGDPISHGSTRFYQVYYRDPAASFCPPPAGNSWNVSSGIAISW